MESDFAGLTINEEEEEVLQFQFEPQTRREVGVFQLVGCFLTASTIHFSAMKSTMANLWHPVQGVQIRNLGGKRYLFQFFHVMDMERIHDIPAGLFSERLAIQLSNFIGTFIDDSFCEAKMALGVEVAGMGWDLSLRAQSRRALAMNSVWLRKEGEGDWGGNREGIQVLGSSVRALRRNMEQSSNIDPILGFNLEGKLSTFNGGENSLMGQSHTSMDYDLEDRVLIGEEGKKKVRGKSKM
ncbi:hypothetical protein Gotri_008024 [Gossypium trilobum]|uniref:DUF4283 domain-containing protein n=1 Tax=Gossypium trilobum TaxID=34281 RepID=A0A7J9EI18_9ROSI|nr:hypothetical protein [Gossypium trilobum]